MRPVFAFGHPVNNVIRSLLPVFGRRFGVIALTPETPNEHRDLTAGHGYAKSHNFHVVLARIKAKK